MMRTYSELILLPTFEERYEYLKLDGQVGQETFGSDRYLYQLFYKDREWLSIRNDVIIRDAGRDLGIEGRELNSYIIVHHMNPITRDDIINRTELLLNPEYLICVSARTHKAIHYSDSGLLISDPVIRQKNDTCPWKR